jgi:hypothetical protein
MQENAALTPQDTGPSRPRSAVAAGRLPQGWRLDGRTYVARRIRELTAGLLAELGGNASPLLAVRVRRVAELTAAAEVLRNRALKGESIDIDKLTKLESETRRAERALGIKIEPGKSAAPTLAEYLAAKHDKSTR